MSIDVSGKDEIEVVGESFYRGAVRRIAIAAGEGEPDRFHSASLVPDPANPYDKNAVKVTIDGEHVGHLPRELAALVAAPIAALVDDHGEVTVDADIRGSDSELGFGVVVKVDLSRLNVVRADEIEEATAAVRTDLTQPTTTAQVENPNPGRPAVGEERTERRRPIIEQAVAKWKTDLIDLTARNRLLFMRELTAGTLSFDSAARDVLMRLVAGERVALSRIVPRSKRPENPAAKLSPFEDAVRRMRTIVRTARTYEEERGVKTLFLACGVATWRDSRASRPPAAPVLLVPLTIRARGASQQDFDLTLAGDLEVNPTLLHMLKVEFNLDLDEQELYDHSEMDGVIDTPEELRLAYNWLSEHCSTVPDWAVVDRFVLANFWYAKLPMVRDLESSIDALASNDVAAAFANDAEARQLLIDQRDDGSSVADVDSLAPQQEFNVLDSDSSQSRAVARAREGRNLVLKGPPGTGKSQTIANLIANAIAEGKRILFVAEKRAAIQAVTKRLDAADLGGLVLDLHQGAESRRWLASEIGASLSAVREAPPVARSTEDARLGRARGGLAEHVRALHESHPPLDISIFDAQMEVLRRGRPTLSARLRGPDLEATTEERFSALDESLRDLLTLKGLSLVARGSPWAEARVDSAEVARGAEDLLTRSLPLVERLAEGARRLADECGMRRPETMEQATLVIAVWDGLRACGDKFDLSILNDDLDRRMQVLEPLRGSGFGRMLATVSSGEYRSELAGLHELVVSGWEPTARELYEGLLESHEIQGQWAGLRLAESIPPRPNDVAEAEAADLSQLRDLLTRLSDVVGRDLTALSFPEIERSLSALLGDVATLRVLPTTHRARKGIDEAGLGSFLRELEAHQELLDDAREELARIWWQSIADDLAMLPSSDSLVSFRGELHNQIADEFRSLDRQHTEASADRVRRIAAEAAVEAQDRYPDQAQLVQSQAKRKRGHLPIREFFSKAPDVLTALRPCWVMSPLMVSQLIPSERAYFDIVVFDEASQVRPVEALSSVIRGGQLVVAGDERQLPPTAFFDTAAVSDDADDAEDSTDISDFESLLDILMTLFDTEMLRWHYRSRDERLIEFSNREIYDGKLTTFPGAVNDDVLEHILVDEPLPDDGHRVSPDAEVDRVVELVLDHARSRADESLGVIALGIKHADAIDAALLTEMPNHPDLEEFFSEDREERFFVKNLERVQGDERDAIILAVGYGKEADGSLPHRFGPLNAKGGERRLNVAVTRAKRRMTLVSSFRADDIDLNRAASEGVRLLRAFLAYADAGGEPGTGSDGTALRTALHDRIGATVEAAGYECDVLHGLSGERIDVVVRDAESGGLTVAIEIDGDAYRRRPSVRDRDRLRREQLERLGWRYVNTWSQDWFRDPAAAARELVEAVGKAFAEGSDDSGPAFESRDGDAAGDSQAGGSGRGPRPTLSSGGQSITDWSRGDLLKLAAWIESDGLLRTSEELKTELMTELGIRRRGSRVVRVLDEVVAVHRSSGGTRAT